LWLYVVLDIIDIRAAMGVYIQAMTIDDKCVGEFVGGYTKVLRRRCLVRRLGGWAPSSS
jgi:hypothetical protein